MKENMNTLEKALIFAVESHSGQTRKKTEIPFITHPIEVGNTIREMTQKDGKVDIEAVAAGFLHDVVEDTDVSIEEINEKFGDVVAQLVSCQTEDKSKTWQERKDHTMEFLAKNTSKRIEICVLADKLANVRSLEKEYREVGENLWSKFNAGKEKQFWYYNTIAGKMKYVRDTKEFHEYKSLLEKIFGE